MKRTRFTDEQTIGVLKEKLNRQILIFKILNPSPETHE